jgi:hypothetical protein
MFSFAELFLLAWATIATVYAVVVDHRYRQHVKRMVMSETMLVGLFEGTATMEKLPKGGAKFVNKVDDESEDTITFEPRR